MFLELESSLECVEQAFTKTFKQTVKLVKIPGFRQGKAPRHIFEKHYGKDLLIQDSVNEAVNETYKDALKELDLDIVDYPKNLKIEDYKENEPIKFTCEVDIKPEIKAEKYKGVKVTVEPSVIDQSLVDKQINQLRESQSTYELVDREAKEEDLLKVNVKASIDNEPYSRWTKNNVGVCIGTSIFSKDFDKELVGKKSNTPTTFSVPYASDYHLKDVAGKKVDFEVEITEIKEKTLAELTDELVTKVSEFKTVSELTENIKTSLEEQHKKQRDESIKTQIMEQLIEKHTIDIPEGMIKSEVEQDQRYLENQLKQSKLSIEQYLKMMNQSEEEYLSKLKETATKRIKSQLILEAVVRQEKIEPTEEDLHEEIKRLRPELDTKEKITTELKKLNVNGLKQMLAQQKSFDFLVKNAKVTEKKEKKNK